MTESSSNGIIVSKRIAGKGRTYFLDLRRSQKGAKYVQLTEVRNGKEGESTRNSLFLFPDRVPEFQTALSELADQL